MAAAAPMHVTPVDHAAVLVCHLCAIATTRFPSRELGAVVVFHLPLTIVMGVDNLMALITIAVDAVLGRHIHVFSQASWTYTLDHLPETNPLAPFCGTIVLS